MSEQPMNEEAKVFTEEYVKQLRDENARRRLAEKNVKDELARVRAALGFKDEETADLAKSAEALRSQSAADRETARDALLRAGFAEAAAKRGFVDADAAFRLADLSAVKVDFAARKVDGLDEALDALADDKPFLLGRRPGAGSPGGGTPRGAGREDDGSLSIRVRRQFERRIPKGMSVPGNNNPGGLRITR
jgi:hypothetical protein